MHYSVDNNFVNLTMARNQKLVSLIHNWKGTFHVSNV